MSDRKRPSLPEARLAPAVAGAAPGLFSSEALAFVSALEEHFGSRREALLVRRAVAQGRVDDGARPAFANDTHDLREGDWTIEKEAPRVLSRAPRLVSVAGLGDHETPVVLDLFDATSPTFDNVVRAQLALRQAARRLGMPRLLGLRPRGLALVDEHVLAGERPVSAGLLDAGLFLFHAAADVVEREDFALLGLAGLEHAFEARLWGEVCAFAEDTLGLPHGCVRLSVTLDTLPAAFQLDEILFELRARVAAVDFDPCAYAASFVKTLRSRRHVLPERESLDRGADFLAAARARLALAAERRGVPAHLDGPVASEWDARGLLATPGGRITAEGLRRDARRALGYLERWLGGLEATDVRGEHVTTASAELARCQVWQWIEHEAELDDGRRVDVRLVLEMLVDVRDEIYREMSARERTGERTGLAIELADWLMTAPHLEDSIAEVGYGHLVCREGRERRAG